MPPSPAEKAAGERSLVLSLDLSPATAERLARHPARTEHSIEHKDAAERAEQPGRGGRLRLLWHDDAQASLAARGLALAETDTAWLLLADGVVRLSQPRRSGLAALLDKAGLAALLDKAGLSIADSLAPRWRFEGTCQDLGRAGAVRRVLWRGRLGAHAGTATPIARLVLQGKAAALTEAGLALAAQHALRPPAPGMPAFPASLAARSTGAAATFTPAPYAIPPSPLAAPMGREALRLADEIAAIRTGGRSEGGRSEGGRSEGGRNEEAVHQARVALRRLRTLLALGARTGLLHPDPAVLGPLARAEMRRLNAALGPVREWDVFLTETLPGLSAALPGEASLAPLAEAAGQARAVASRRLAAMLAEAGPRRLGVLLGLLATTAPRLGEKEAGARAGAALSRGWKRLQAGAGAIAEGDIAALHRLRLTTKRQRYASEALGPLFGEKRARRAVKRLAALQAALGLLNDGATAAHLLAALPQHARAGGLVEGFAAAHAEQGRSELAGLWRKCRRDAVFWT